MDAVTPNGPQAAETHSHVVRPDSMEWQQTRFPGCEAKTLLFDRSTGLMTALMRFAPGAVLPDHEHVNIEQTFVLEGRLVDKEGPAQGIEARAGEFIWRETGSRHVAWCPEGGLMLAIFQVPTSSSRPTAASSMPRARTGTRPGATPARAEASAARIRLMLSTRRNISATRCGRIDSPVKSNQAFGAKNKRLLQKERASG
jgi:quercetin dioxygenase-like cupin family protein